MYLVQVQVFDVFELALILPALTLSECNLGPLIFGATKWKELAAQYRDAYGVQLPLVSDDPLTTYCNGVLLFVECNRPL
jgi:hypothetical protein